MTEKLRSGALTYQQFLELVKIESELIRHAQLLRDAADDLVSKHPGDPDLPGVVNLRDTASDVFDAASCINGVLLPYRYSFRDFDDNVFWEIHDRNNY